VKVSADSQSLEEILNQILFNTDLSYKILDDQVVIYRDETKTITAENEKDITEQVTQQKGRFPEE